MEKNHLYIAKTLIYAPHSHMIKKLVPLFLVTLLLTGCATTITNLTPSTLPRNPENVYHLEAMLTTSDSAIRQDSIQASVLIGLESYPMQPTPLVENRWEILVPIPADTDRIHYRYKFDYLYDAIPQPRPGSKLSPGYTLRIIDQ